MNIVMTGASGFIGKRLVSSLAASGHEIRVLSRRAGREESPGVRTFAWDPMAGPPPEESLQGADAVVHLAGEPVAQRWTPEAKRRIRESRVVGTRNLVGGLARTERPPEVLVSASAVGYYGSRGDEILREEASPADTWLAEVCVAWEREAFAAEKLGVRVAAIRIGLALHPSGGALKQMLPPFRLGVGGRLGSGKQWMPWIHLADLTALFEFAVEQPVRGPLNGAAPYPVTNAEFTHALGKAIHRPALMVVPPIALKLLYGEMAEITLASQRVVPAAAESAGFRFRHPQLDPALLNLFAQ